MTDIVLHLLEFVGQEAALWLLGAVSLASMTVALERLLYLRARRVDVDKLVARLTAAVDRGDFKAAEAIAAESPAMEAQVGARMLQCAGRPRGELEDVYRAAIERQRLRYERALGWLATVGSNAPFVGLFGTVLGIVKAFAVLSNSTGGAARNAMILGSISEALVATAVGIGVAIPAVVAFNALGRRVETAVAGSEVVFRELAARIAARQP